MARRKSGKELTFEELLAETEEAVEQLENGELPLDEAMERYERGVRNLKKCSTLIETAQKKVEQMIEKSGEEWTLEPFAEQDEDDEASSATEDEDGED